jgi:hypothetical protein
MNNFSGESSQPVPRVSHGWLIALAGLLGMVVVPGFVSFAMLAYDALDPMCGGGGEGAITCGMRAFVITLMSILPGLLIGVFAGQALARRRGRQVNA